MRSLFAAIPLGVVLLFQLPAHAQSPGDKAFLHKSIQGDVLEVELGKLALQKTSRPDVRSFAQTMVTDHEKLAASFKPFLEKAGVTPSPSLDSAHQKLFKRLNALSGPGFDREYIKEMQLDHQRDLGEYASEIRRTHDRALRSAVRSARETLVVHARMVTKLAHQWQLAPPGLTERRAGKIIR